MQSKTILIVEDDKFQRAALKEALIKVGFNVLESSDGAEAMELLLKEKPAVILLDLVLLQIHGDTFLKQLRSNKDGYCDKVPVIILTNKSDVDLEQEVKSQGIHCYLSKANSSLKEVVDCVKTAL